jgi:hypothetical protein
VVAGKIRKEVIRMEAVILEILQVVGVYDKAREKVSSDSELARMFDQDFDGLIRLLSNETASEGSSPGRA